MPPEFEHIDRGEVHTWIASPESATETLLRDYAALLDDAERRRLARLPGERERRQFLVARALVRDSLSRYAAVAPGDWRFSEGAKGRPEIAAPAGVQPLRFNLSHTTGLVVCAVALNADIGVDVEDLERDVEDAVLGRRYFTPAESRSLAALAPADRKERFFRYWTLKEAYLKARGLGLSASLDRIEFDLAGGSPRLRCDPTIDPVPSRWRFLVMQPTPRHLLALAMECAVPIALRHEHVIPLTARRSR